MAAGRESVPRRVWRSRGHGRGGEEVTKKGTKRKRAPCTKGPCEHGVKYRSNCKVCSACPHGTLSSVSNLRTVVHRCKECGGAQSASTGVSALGAVRWFNLQRSSALSGGSQICEHGRQRSTCKECGGSQICVHGRRRSQFKECGGASICEHGRQRHKCKECGGSQICVHGRRRSQCKECGGSGICEHGRQRYKCKECSHK